MLPWPGHVRLAETYFVVVDIFVLSYVNYMKGGGKCLKLVLFEKIIGMNTCPIFV